MPTLPQSFKDEGERPVQPSPWVWLIEVEVNPRRTVGGSPAAQTVFRFTSDQQRVYWPNALSQPPGKFWYPFPFEFSPIEDSGEGDLPQMDLNLGNVTREVMQYLHSEAGFQGNAVTLYLVNRASIDIASPDEEFLRFDFRIAGTTATADGVSLRLEMPNFFQRKSPQDRFSGRQCRFKFGGPECGYPINAAAAFTTCGKTLTDCIARGDDEVARNLARLHPLRFGGFPGIPQQRNV